MEEKIENQVKPETLSPNQPSLPKVSIVVGSLWLEQCDRIPKVENRVNFISTYLKSTTYAIQMCENVVWLHFLISFLSLEDEQT